MGKSRLRSQLAGLFFIVAGANHFRSPDLYLSIVPPFLPWHSALVYISGAAEVMGGLGVLMPGSRAMAGWGLIALLVAVFPANVYGAFHGMNVAGHAVPVWLLWARLPVQALLIWWVYWACISVCSRGNAHLAVKE